ncbi:MAG: ABC transporter ATP-binding protein [Clostridia bacterium]|nr:ABC transporter ATP-binding protein [Clostridia bacterium]
MIKLVEIKKHFTVSDNGKPRQIEVLKNINLHVSSGEYVSIKGKSGSGKSTLLNIIGLLDAPSGGEFFLDGEKIDTLKDCSFYRQKYLGFIFQSYHLMNSLTVRENLELPLIYRNQKIDGAVINALSENFQIDHLLNNKAVNLSGGEKQRVAIARAMATSPEIIICDEPTGNLDDENTNIVLDAFDKLKAQGKTLILVTHSDKVAEKADTHYLLEDGGLIKYD